MTAFGRQVAIPVPVERKADYRVHGANSRLSGSSNNAANWSGPHYVRFQQVLTEPRMTAIGRKAAIPSSDERTADCCANGPNSGLSAPSNLAGIACSISDREHLAKCEQN